MQVVSKKTLKAFWAQHHQAEIPLTAWYAIAAKAGWKTPTDIKAEFGANVDFIGDNRVIFDISSNKYRLIVHVSYRYKAIMIKFVGTHAQYDRIDPETI
jgi:mRNA interferase HigB